MTPTIIRESKELVKKTRQDLGLSMEAFGELLGVTKQMIQMVEAGTRTLDLERIGAGMVHPNHAVSLFWLDYYGLRQRELQAALVAGRMAVSHVA